MKQPISDNIYFSIQAWMVTKLKLKGAERDVYAIIYGYSQDNDSDFHGSLDYISQLTGYSRNAICTALKSLTDSGLITKTEKIVNNIKYCRYCTSNLYAVQVTCTGNEKSVQVTCTGNEKSVQVTCINNNSIKNNNSNISKYILEEGALKQSQWFINNYHSICVSLPKVKTITDKRKKAIVNLMKSHNKEEILKVFELVEASDFLKGDNDRGWKADIDFILREDKFVSISEGKYGGKKRTKSVMRDIEHLDALAERANKKGLKDGQKF